MAAKKKTELTIRKTQAVATIPDYGEDRGKGISDAKREEMMIPFLTVIQGLSPQLVKPVGQGGIKGAKLGMIYNTVTDEMTPGDVGLKFVPAFRENMYVEWKPRDAGGGLVARHAPTSDVVIAAKAAWEADPDPKKVFGKLKTPDGNDLTETWYLYGIVVDDDLVPTGLPVVLSFKSMGIKIYKKIIGRMFSLKGQPPLFANVLSVTTKFEPTKKGDFYNFAIDFVAEDPLDGLLAMDSVAYRVARSLCGDVESGDVKADMKSMEKNQGDTADSETAQF